MTRFAAGTRRAVGRGRRAVSPACAVLLPLLLSLLVLLPALPAFASGDGGPGALASAHHRLVTAPVTHGGSATARFVEDRGLVSVVELAGPYDRDLSGGEANAEPRSVVARELLAHRRDEFDFLVLFTTFDFEVGPAQAFAWVVRNDVEGLGLPLFDRSAEFGSDGVLDAVIDMASIDAWVTDPTDPRFHRTLSVLAHEILHRWGAYVQVQRADGSLGYDLLGAEGSHWSFLLDTDASVLYGADWHDGGDGTFTSRGVLELFSPLDLYLAGFLAAGEVPPFFLVESAGVDASRLPEAGVTLSGTRREIAIEDVIAAEGPRVPAAGEAPKRFRAAFALLTRPGVPVTGAQVAAVDRVRRSIESRFAALTGGRAVLRVEPRAVPVEPPGTDAPLEPGDPRDDAASVADGLAWLRHHRSPEGWWQDREATRVRDTSAAIGALTALDPTFADGDLSRSWLAEHGDRSVDSLARAALGLQPFAATDLHAALLGLQNGDGGWGAGPGFVSDPLDTALAVRTLARAGTSPVAAEAARRGTDHLLATANPDGAWGGAVGAPSRTGVTAIAVRALAAAGRTVEAVPALTWLAGRQNPDGGFGDSPSTVHDTGLALAALIDAGRLGEVDAAGADAYLRSRQDADGAWAGSVYATALAVSSLRRSVFPNWRFAGPPGVEPVTPTDGRPVVLTLRVENDGSAPTPPGVLRLYDGAPEDGGTPAAPDASIPGLAAGGAVDVEVVWETLDRSGSHTLVAVLDPDSATEELSETDNRTSVDLEVAPAPDGVDLQVTESEVLVTPSQPVSLPAELAVAVTVRNLGRADASDVLVRLRAGAVPGEGALVDEKRVAVPGRSSTVVGFSHVHDTIEPVYLGVELDPEGEIAEAEESNNAASVLVTPGTGVDLAVGEIGLDGDPLQGLEVLFRVPVANRGTAAAEAVEVSYRLLDGGSGGEEIARHELVLDAGVEEVREVPWRVDRIGALTFVAEVDPLDAVAEVDETNNRSELDLTAAGADAPNLVIETGGLVFAPDPALEGLPVTLTATVSNPGGSASGSVEVSFFEGDPEQGGEALGTVTLPQVAAGVSEHASLTTNPLPDAGDRLLFAVADPGGAVAEVSEDDNRTFATLEVLGRPDLAVNPSAFALDPALPQPGDPLTVSVTVANLGEQTAEGVVVRLESGGSVFAPDAAVGDVAGGGTATAVFEGVFPAGAEEVLLVATADPAGEVPEAVRANNRAERPVAAFDDDAPVQPALFSPNGDGVQDATFFSFSAATPVVAVEVRDARGELVRRRELGGATAEGRYRWDGLDGRGRVVSDGAYTFAAVDASGRALFTAPVTVDTDRSPLLDALGTPFERVTNLTCSVGNPVEVQVPPDDEDVFLVNRSVYDHSGPVLRSSPPGSRSAVVIVPERVRSLDVSSDGEKIAFTTEDGDRGEEWYANADGTGRQSTGDPRFDDYAFTTFGFAGDGQDLVYYDRDDATIYLRPLDGSGPERAVATFTDRPKLYFQGFSPDGSHLAFDDCGYACGTLHVVDLEEGSVVELVGTDGWRELAWSPDGRRLAVTDRVFFPEPYEYHGRLYVYGVDGSLERTVELPPIDLADVDAYGDLGVGPPEYGQDVTEVLQPSWADSGQELVSGAFYEEYGPNHRAEFSRLFQLDVTTGETETIGWAEPTLVQFSYHVSTWDGGEWVERGVLHHGRVAVERSLDLTEHLPDADGEYKVRIRQEGMDAAHVDRVVLAMGESARSDDRVAFPREARLATGKAVLAPVARADRRLLDLHGRSMVVRWDAPPEPVADAGVHLRLLAREESLEGRPDRPFRYPAESGRAFQHRVGSGGALRVDGRLTGADALGKPLFSTFTLPDTGHPSAPVRGWVTSDGEALYAVLDFAVDNTVDGERDWAALEVETADGWRTFEVRQRQQTWGEVDFVNTSAATWRHKVYEFRVPLAELGLASGDTVSVRFRAYGTAAVLPGDELFESSVGDVLWMPGDRTVLYWSDYSGYAYAIDLDAENHARRVLARYNTFANASLSDSRKRLLFWDAGEILDPESECYHELGDHSVFALDSLANLAAELRGEPAAGGSGILLRGTATDLHLERWILEYAREDVPGFWTPILPPSTVPVVDGELTTWVPPAAGAYRVRLTVEDRAGNRRNVERRFSSAGASGAALADVWVSPRLLSPDGDGHLDAATLHYRVLAPTHLEVAVVDADGARVRTFRRDHAVVGEEHELVWAGRDDAGRPLPDGTYRIEVAGYRFPVELDTVAPTVAGFQVSGPAGVEEIGDALWLTASPGVAWTVDDDNPGDTLLESGLGENPLRWTPTGVVVGPGSRCDEQRCSAELPLDVFTGRRFRLEARDGAGNRSLVTTPLASEALVLWAAGPQRDAVPAVSGEMGRIAAPGALSAQRLPQRLRVSESVVSNLVGAGLDLCVPADGAACGAGDWHAAQGVQVLDPATAIPVVGDVPDLTFDLAWDLPMDLGLDASRARVRVRGVDDRGRVFLSNEVRIGLGGAVSLFGLYARAAGEPTVDLSAAAEAAGLDLDAGRVLWGRETFPENLTDVSLFLVSDEDPRYSDPVPVPLAAVAGGTMVFDGADLEPCLAYRGWIAARTVEVPGGPPVRDVRSPEETIRPPCLELEAELRADLACGELAPTLRTVRLVPHAYLDTEPALLSLALGSPDDLLFTESRPIPDRAYEVVVDTADLEAGTHLLIARLGDGEGEVVERRLRLPVDRALPTAAVTHPLPGQRLCAELRNGRRELPILGRAADNGSGLALYLQSRPAGTDAWSRDSGGSDAPEAPWVRELPDAAPDPDLAQGWQPFATPGEERFEGELNVLPGSAGEDGELELRLLAIDTAGNTTCTTPVRFGLDSAVEAPSVQSDLDLISPNGDGVADAAQVSFRAAEAVSVDVQVYAGRPTRTLLAERVIAEGPPLRTVVSGLSTGGGGSATWDGRGDGGAGLPDGLYAVVVRFADGCGNSRELVTAVTLDTTPPAVVVDSPAPGSELGQIVEVRGTVADPHLESWRLEYGLGSNPFTWSAVGGGEAAVAGGSLAVWNTLGLDGDLTLRLLARDRAGNRAETALPVAVPASDPLLTDLEVSPPLISPDGDGVLDTTAVRLSLAEPAEVRLEIADGGGVTVRTLVGDESLTAGSVVRSWDGLDDGGSAVPDGAYRVRVLLTDADAPSRQQDEDVGVVVDTEAPTLEVERPRDGYSPADAAVSGTVTDPHLAAWSVALSREPVVPGWVPLAEGTDEVRDGELAAYSGLAPGAEYALRLLADDTAGNRTERVVELVVDDTAPAVAIAAPAGGAARGAAGGPLRVEGRVAEDHLRFWELELGVGADPASWTPVAEGGEPVGDGAVPERLADLDLTGLADGLYTLRLAAEDLGGLSSQARSRFAVDNSAPTAALNAPAPGAFLTGPTAVIGTAADPNLLQYVVELAPSAAGPFSELGRSSAAVVGGTLLDWRVLPSDGSYVLRLRVDDRAGNRSASTVRVTVDRSPPAAPTGLTADPDPAGVRLAWSPNSEPDLAGYRLYRNGEPVNATPVAVPSFLDDAVREGRFAYTVVAVDRAGQESAPSAPVELTVDLTPPRVALHRPADGERVGALVDLVVTASSDDLAEYRLTAIPAAGGEPVPLRTSPVPVVRSVAASWDTGKLPAESGWTLRLEAEDLSGNTAAVEAAVTVDNQAPPAPGNLTATAVGNRADLAWDAVVATDLAGYLVYRNGVLVLPGAGDDLVDRAVSSTEYADTDLPDGRFVYTVRAVDRAGNPSAPSVPAEVMVDERAPAAVLVEPADGQRLDRPVPLRATSDDSDLAGVRFQMRAEGAADWTVVDEVSGGPPWTVDWDPSGLPFGTYSLRAMATDRGGLSDANPAEIEVVYTDLGRPAPVSDVVAEVDGGRVTLSWSGVDDADLAGYRVERTLREGNAVLLTEAPQAPTTLLDAGLPDGVYTYAVWSEDTYGNVSVVTSTEALTVHTPDLERPFTPTRATSAELTGRVVAGSEVVVVVEGPSGSTDLAPAPVDADGRFRVAPVPLQSGENRIAAVAVGPGGRRSKEAAVTVVSAAAPPAPRDLAASVSGLDVDLTWSPVPGAVGYRPFRDGEPLLPDADVTDFSLAEASSEVNTYSYSAYRAVNDRPWDYWAPQIDGEHPAAGQWLAVRWDAPLQVSALRLDFYAVDYRAVDYDLQAWDGAGWQPLAAVRDNPDDVMRTTLAEPYRTTAVRVVLRAIAAGPDADSRPLRVAEVDVEHQPLVAGPAHTDTAPDGIHRYVVTAVAGTGFESEPSGAVEVPLGDVEGPSPVTLSGVLDASHAVLTWTASPAPDLARYEVLRDGVAVASVDASAERRLRDGPLHNGTWTFAVRGVDAVGNPGPLSNPVELVVAEELPGTPRELAVSEVPTGGALDLAWSPPVDGALVVAYEVLVSTDSGGPYEVVAETAGTTHRVGGLENAREHFFVVRAVDAAGNRGPASSEASGTPRDLLAPPPALLHFPGFPGVPHVTPVTSAPVVAGLAEPGASVVLSWDDSPVAQLDASAETTVAALLLDLGDNPPRPSPDGRWLAFAPWWIADVYSFDAAALEPAAAPLDETWSWMPDNRSVVGLEYDYPRDRVVAHDVIEGVTRDLAVVDWGRTAMPSPRGDRLALVGEKDGLAGLLLLDLADGSVRELVAASPRDFETESLVWSRDGGRIAYRRDTSGDVLELLDLGTGAVTLLDDAPGAASVPSLSPDGGSAFFTAWTADGVLRAWRLDLGTGDRTELPTSEGDVELARLSPDGRRLAYVLHDGSGRHVELLDIGSGRVERVRDFIDGRVEPTDLQWSGSGHLHLLDDGDHLRITPAGHFEAGGLALRLGDNPFTAAATDRAGNRGGDSAPMVIRVTGEDLPNLAVSGDDLAVLPGVPVAGEPVVLGARIENRGAVASPVSELHLLLRHPDGTLEPVDQGVLLDPVAPGALRGVSRELVLGAAAGRYSLVVVIDPSSRVRESDETDNRAERSFPVAAAAEPFLAVDTDRDTYGAAEPVAILLQLANAGPDLADTHVELTVEDAEGFLVEQLAPLALGAVPSGSTETRDASWSTGEVFAGAYRVVARLRSGGLELAEAATPFTVSDSSRLATRVSTEEPAYAPGDVVRIRSEVDYLEGNAALPGAVLGLRVVAPDEAVAAEWVEPLGDLLPGSHGEEAVDWDSVGAAAGTYRAVAEVHHDAGLRVVAETQFELTSAPAAVAGSLTLSDADPAVGATVTASWRVSDAGGAGATALPVRLSLRRAGSVGDVASHDRTVDLPVGGEAVGEVAFGTSGLALGGHVVVLTAGEPEPRTLSTVAFTTRDGTAPNLEVREPAAGAVVPSEVRVLASALDSLSPVRGLEASIDGSGWTPLEAADPVAGDWRGVITGLSEGEHTLTVRATDAWGNAVTARARSLVADLTPPRITIRGVEDAQTYGGPVTPVVEVVEEHPAEERISLDGEPFVLGALVSEPGEHELVVEAIDRAGNRAEARVRFAVEDGGEPPGPPGPPTVPEIPALGPLGLLGLGLLLATAGWIVLRRRRGLRTEPEDAAMGTTREGARW